MTVATPPTAAIDALSPEQRLSASRKRLVTYMAQGEESASPQDTLRSSASTGEIQRPLGQPKSMALQTLTRTVQAWWRHHPAKVALEIAEPVLDQYAKNKPYQLLGIAAAAGAAAVLVRPWRLVSVTGLLLATLKSSGLANVALSFVSGQPKQGLLKQQRPQQDKKRH